MIKRSVRKGQFYINRMILDDFVSNVSHKKNEPQHLSNVKALSCKRKKRNEIWSQSNLL